MTNNDQPNPELCPVCLADGGRDALLLAGDDVTCCEECIDLVEGS